MTPQKIDLNQIDERNEDERSQYSVIASILTANQIQHDTLGDDHTLPDDRQQDGEVNLDEDDLSKFTDQRMILEKLQQQVLNEASKRKNMES